MRLFFLNSITFLSLTLIGSQLKAQTDAQSSTRYFKTTLSSRFLYTDMSDKLYQKCNGQSLDNSECFTQAQFNPDEKLIVSNTIKPRQITYRFKPDSEEGEEQDTTPITTTKKFVYVVSQTNPKNQGWIEENNLSRSYEPDYTQPWYKKIADAVLPCQNPTSAFKNSYNIGKVTEAVSSKKAQTSKEKSQAVTYDQSQFSDKQKTFSSIKEAITNLKNPPINQCYLQPPNYANTLKGSLDPGVLVYDQLILEKFSPNNDTPVNQLTKVKTPSGKPITYKQLQKIDALARTLNAEMASCKGNFNLTNVKAIARIMVNRAQLIEKNKCTQFIQANEKVSSKAKRVSIEHDDQKDALTKVVTTPVQFSCWNQLVPANYGSQKKENNLPIKRKTASTKTDKNAPSFVTNTTGLMQTLCPVRPDEDPNCKKLKNANQSTTCFQNEKQNYDSVYNVALQAVLFEDDFLKETKSLEDFRNYTSFRSSFLDYKKVNKPITIKGEKIDSDCVNLWKMPTKNEYETRKLAQIKKKNPKIKSTELEAKLKEATADYNKFQPDCD